MYLLQKDTTHTDTKQAYEKKLTKSAHSQSHSTVLCASFRYQKSVGAIKGTNKQKLCYKYGVVTSANLIPVTKIKTFYNSKAAFQKGRNTKQRKNIIKYHSFEPFSVVGCVNELNLSIFQLIYWHKIEFMLKHQTNISIRTLWLYMMTKFNQIQSSWKNIMNRNLLWNNYRSDFFYLNSRYHTVHCKWVIYDNVEILGSRAVEESGG